MAASSQYAKVYNIPLDFFVQRMRYIQTSGLGMEMRGEAPVMGGLQFFLKHGVSLTSWGENVTVFLTDQGGATNVTIRSECALATQIVDWGKNTENINGIFMYLERDMAAYYASGAAQPADDRSLPQQNPYSAPAYNPAPQQSAGPVCPNCGTQAPPMSRFCAVCGSPLGG